MPGVVKFLSAKDIPGKNTHLEQEVIKNRWASPFLSPEEILSEDEQVPIHFSHLV